MAKTIQDLTIKELFEDLEYYLSQAQLQSPPFCDNIFMIVRKYITELKAKMEAGEK